MPKVNPNILKWARTTAGFNEEQAARKLGIKDTKKASGIEKLIALESGQVFPTRSQLVMMSKQYHRPLLTFYLSKEPRLGDRGQDYRTLPETIEITHEALVDVVIRDIKTRQALVRSVLEDEDEAENLSFIGSLEMKQGESIAISSLKKHLNWDLNEYRKQPTIEKAFSLLRGQVEEAGVFVLLVDNLGSHHTTIDVEAFRGFALADEVAPFIAINANDSKGAWCFTLVHELVHLLLGETGVSAPYGDQAIEKFCNDVASEFLLPMKEIRQLEINDRTDFVNAKDIIRQFAQNRNVSNTTMVAYKLYCGDLITYPRFQKFKDNFRADWLKNNDARRLKAKENDVKGLYYPTKRQRVGNGLISLVARMMYGGAITTTKAGRVLGVRPQNVQGVLAKSTPSIARGMV